MTDWTKLPTSAPGGDLLPHMSARMRTSVVDSLFEGLGGYDRMKAFFAKNDENYLEFVKLWGKGVAKSTNVEVTASEGIENLLDRLERAENAQTINGDAVEV